MKNNFFYIDESNTKLDNDGPLVIGGLIINEEHISEYISGIKEIKEKHQFKSLDEIKWTKTNRKTLELYSELIEYTLMNDKVFFRAIVAKKPKVIRVGYDNWITRLHFPLISKIEKYRKPNIIIADRRSKKQMVKLVSTIGIISKNKETNIEYVDSKDSLIIQLSDLFIGALMYSNSNIDKKENGKKELSAMIESKWNIKETTYDNNGKYSILFWGKDNE